MKTARLFENRGRIICFALCCCLLSVTSPVVATVSGDIAAGYSMDRVFLINIRKGVPVKQIIREAIRARPNQIRTIIAAALGHAPNQAPDIVDFAIRNGVAAADAVELGVRYAPDQASKIVQAAITLQPFETSSIIRSAVVAGANPREIASTINQAVFDSIQTEPENGALPPDANGEVALLDQSADSKTNTAKTEDGSTTGTTTPAPTPDNNTLVSFPVIVLPPSNGGSDRVASPN